MKNSFYRKIFISFLLVISLYTVIIAVSFLQNAYEQQKLSLETNVKFSMEKKTHEIDNQLLAANNALKLAANQNSIQSFASSNAEAIALYPGIYNDLILNPYFLNYNSQYTIGLTKGIDHEFISTNGYFDFYDYIHFIRLDDRINEISQFFANADKEEVAVIQSDKRVALVRLMNVRKGASPLVFFVTWDKNKLISDKIYGEAGSFSIIDANILQKSSADSGLPYSSLATAEQDSKQNIAVATRNSVTSFVAKSSVVPNVYYEYSINLKEVFTFPTQLIFSLAAYFIVLLCIGLVLLLVLSKRNYRPYELILNEVQRIGGGTNAENVETVLNRIQQLNHENQALLQFQEDVTEEVKELFIKNILLDNYSKKEISKFLEVLDLKDELESGMIAVVTFNGIAAAEENMNIGEKIAFRKKFLQKCCKDYKPAQRWVILDLNVNRYALVLPVVTDDHLANVLEACIKKAGTDLNIKASYSMSVPFHSVQDISRVFSDVYYHSGNVSQDEEWLALTGPAEEFQYKVEIEQMLLQHTGQAHFNEAAKILKDLLDNHLQRKQLHLSLLRDIKLQLLNTLKRAIHNSGLSYQRFMEENRSEILALQQETDPVKVRDRLIAVYESMFAYTSTEQLTEKSLIERIIQYIDSNYLRDLSLREVAVHFNLSESYLSKIIKDYLGVPYKNYLNRLKINEAIRLLQTNHYKINEVAEKVGYANANTFIRIFKQVEGTTPGKYLQQHNE